MKEEGFEFQVKDRVLTIFSAPKYCDQGENKGAFIVFGVDMKPRIQTFEAVVVLSAPSTDHGHALRQEHLDVLKVIRGLISSLIQTHFNNKPWILNPYIATPYFYGGF